MISRMRARAPGESLRSGPHSTMSSAGVNNLLVFLRAGNEGMTPNKSSPTVDGCEIQKSHHLRNIGMIRFPCKNQPIMVSHGFKGVQDFVHPQYGFLCIPRFIPNTLGHCPLGTSKMKPSFLRALIRAVSAKVMSLSFPDNETNVLYVGSEDLCQKAAGVCGVNRRLYMLYRLLPLTWHLTEGPLKKKMNFQVPEVPC